MHRVEHVIHPGRLISVAPTESVHAAAVTMTRHRVGAVPVIEDDALVGVFSERDVLARVVVPRLDPQRVCVADVMTREVATADVGDRTNPCIAKMRAHNCRHLPILSAGRVIAMLSMRDLLRDEIEERNEEIRHLRAYIHQDPPH